MFAIGSDLRMDNSAIGQTTHLAARIEQPVDGESPALLDGLVESIPAARTLLFVNYRPEYQQRWSSRTYYTQLLDKLPAESAGEFLDTLLGADATRQPLKRVLIERTEGSPFFLEECVQGSCRSYATTRAARSKTECGIVSTAASRSRLTHSRA